MKPIANTMIMAIVAPTMYSIRSVEVARFDGVVAVGDSFAGAVSTAKLVSADDGQ
jgi:hypothetical protein